MDATTIHLCLSVFPWAHFRKSKGAIKLHTLLDLRGNIPSFISITRGKVHEVNILDELIPEAGSIYIMDRGYLDINRLYPLKKSSAFFIVRTKRNTALRRLYSMPVEKSSGVRCDRIVVPKVYYSQKDYPEKLHRVKYFDSYKGKNLVYVTNQFLLPPVTIADLCRCRWQVELFFKWIKQHLRIKAFFGTSENAVKTQIWIAVSVYVLAAIVKKRLGLSDVTLYTILQILSVTLFEKSPLIEVLTQSQYNIPNVYNVNQLKLFDI